MRNRKQAKIENPLLLKIQNAIRLNNREALQGLIQIMKTTPVAERNDGADLLCAALSCKQGMDIFFEDQEWRDTLTKDELNKADYFGRNALYLLLNDERGRQLLNNDEIFRKKITKEGFSYGDPHHLSPARVLISTESGIDVLTNHSDLQALISTKALNDQHDNDHLPMIFELAKSRKGINILFHPALRNKITEQGLNAQYQHVSALFLLTSCQPGIVLIEDERLCGLIQPHTLNHVDRQHLSPVAYLCKSEFGQEILLLNRRLAKKIFPVAMTAMEADGTTPFYHLARSEKGISVLAKYDHLCRMMTERIMNQRVTLAGENDVSFLFLLLSHPRGVELLLRNRSWLTLINKAGLHARREYPDGRSVAVLDLLLQPEHKALFALLSDDIQREVHDWHERIAVIVRKNQATLFAAPPVRTSNKGKEEMARLSL